MFPSVSNTRLTHGSTVHILKAKAFDSLSISPIYITALTEPSLSLSIPSLLNDQHPQILYTKPHTYTYINPNMYIEWQIRFKSCGCWGPAHGRTKCLDQIAYEALSPREGWAIPTGHAVWRRFLDIPKKCFACEARDKVAEEGKKRSGPKQGDSGEDLIIV
jgi:hypothetical protein